MLRWLYCIDEAALAGLPELAPFEDAQERAKALGAIERKSPVGRAWIDFVSIAIFTAMVGLVFRRIDSWWLFTLIPLSVCGGLLLRFVSVFSTRRRAAIVLRHHLLKCGIPVCLDCGYCLRGVTSARCPECGREIDPRVAELIRTATHEEP